MAQALAVGPLRAHVERGEPGQRVRRKHRARRADDSGYSRAVLVTILTIAEIVYVVVLATWILFEKRPPVSTIAWILALIALPYVGLVVFFFLGARRLDRKRLGYQRVRDSARAEGPSGGGVAAPPSAPPELEDPRIAQLDRLPVCSGEPPTDVCEEVTVFHDAATTFDAIEAAIADARRHVHVGYYIFDSGRAGERVCDALVERAEAGVVVRVLVDDVGSSGMTRAMAQRMRRHGIELARFNPVTFSRLRSRFDFRNHRKIVVCDGTVGFTGGINICDDYVPEADAHARASETSAKRRRLRRGHPGPWRDTHVRLRGDAVRWLQLAFLCDWNYAAGRLPRELEYFPPPSRAGRHRVQILTSGPDRDVRPIESAYFSAITLARARVLVTTPYFVPDQAMMAALTTAARRGVDVRVLVPRRSDSLIVTAAARSYYDAVIASGARIYEYQPTMVHAKTLVVDDFFAAVGTANMDNRSFRLNFEITAVLYGSEHASDLAAQFARDLEQAREITRDVRRRLTLGWRTAEASARVLSPLL